MMETLSPIARRNAEQLLINIHLTIHVTKPERLAYCLMRSSASSVDRET
jgi:hypothetical protein